MSLEDKSNENLRLVDNYVKSRKYPNIVASRAYYAVYQRIKHYLQNHETDYIKFLNESGTLFDPDNKYKHSLINLVLLNYTFQRNKGKKIDQRELNQLLRFHALRHMREKADYEKNDITEPEAKASCTYAKSLTPIIDKYLS